MTTKATKPKLPKLHSKGLDTLWAVADLKTGALRLRVVTGGSFGDWQAKIYTTKKVALKYARVGEVVLPISIKERAGKKEFGR